MTTIYKHLKKHRIALVIILGSLFFALGYYYYHLYAMGEEARQKPREWEVRLKVLKIDKGHNQRDNTNDSSKPLYATSSIRVTGEDFEHMKTFDDYVDYAKSHQLTYNPYFYYLDDSKFNKEGSPYRKVSLYRNQYVKRHLLPIYTGDINLLQKTAKELSEKSAIPLEKVDHRTLLLLERIQLQPLNPDLQLRRVTLDYNGKLLVTSLLLPRGVSDRKIDYIFMNKEMADSLFNGDIFFDFLLFETFSHPTYQDHGFGFITRNYARTSQGGSIISPGSGYIAYTNDSWDSDRWVNSVLYIAIENEDTGEEKVFSKNYYSAKEDADSKELISLLTGDWERK